jgi:hypothetical protein
MRSSLARHAGLLQGFVSKSEQNPTLFYTPDPVLMVLQRCLLVVLAVGRRARLAGSGWMVDKKARSWSFCSTHCIFAPLNTTCAHASLNQASQLGCGSKHLQL